MNSDDIYAVLANYTKGLIFAILWAPLPALLIWFAWDPVIVPFVTGAVDAGYVTAQPRYSQCYLMSLFLIVLGVGE